MNDFSSQVSAAEKVLRSILPPTPLQRSNFLSEKYEANIFLKREDLTPVRSYKIRGAFFFFSSFLEKNQKKNSSFVCASAGNHAQGFAFSCAHFQVLGKIFMPTTTPPQKVTMTKSFGGKNIEVILVGDTFDEAAAAAKECCAKEKSIFVPPFDDKRIIIAAGTVAQEILGQIKKPVDILITPIGGGGLSAGISEFFREQSSQTQIFCAEPKEAPSLFESLRQKKRITLEKMSTFVDGCAVAQIGKNNLTLLQKNITEETLLIPENRLCQTMIDFLHHEGIILEPAGALSLDALKNIPLKNLKGKTVVCIVSGGNFDFERLPEVKERSLRYSGLKKYFLLRLPQRPGALREFLSLLGDEDDIARFEYLKKSAKNFGSVLLGIETKNVDNFPALFDRLTKAGFDFHDVTDDELLADFVI